MTTQVGALDSSCPQTMLAACTGCADGSPFYLTDKWRVSRLGTCQEPNRMLADLCLHSGLSYMYVYGF